MHPKSPNFVLDFGVLFVWRIKLALYTKIRKIFLDFKLLTLSICIDKLNLILYNKLSIIGYCAIFCLDAMIDTNKNDFMHFIQMKIKENEVWKKERLVLRRFG